MIRDSVSRVRVSQNTVAPLSVAPTIRPCLSKSGCHQIPFRIDSIFSDATRYLYWAKITREEEQGISGGTHPLRKLLGFTTKKERAEASEPHNVLNPAAKEKEIAAGTDSPNGNNAMVVTDAEWVQASRALRTATWGAVFYLITTDILGPYSVPWAFAQMGYGPGVALYVTFGALAGYTGWQLWRMFLMLDSNQFPMKTYGDFAFRIYGTIARHLVNVLQSIQLIFNVGIIIIGNGQGIYQINSNICYIVCKFTSIRMYIL